MLIFLSGGIFEGGDGERRGFLERKPGKELPTGGINESVRSHFVYPVLLPWQFSKALERVWTVNDCEAVVVGHAETLKTHAVK